MINLCQFSCQLRFYFRLLICSHFRLFRDMQVSDVYIFSDKEYHPFFYFCFKLFYSLLLLIFHKLILIFSGICPPLQIFLSSKKQHRNSMINKVQVVIESLPQRKKKIKTERIKEIIYQLLCCICSLPSSTKKTKTHCSLLANKEKRL